ncbi:unnamed protein product [Lepeophtheirus salmonis]|uniref:(salmon louse) hypothetical protein n=1 Tax=Lepeophtheirus salmonis TaxID=72036 RepID=A0A7R8D6V6_LEPSM|nr:unnamed protein product [Lepeophtheirus salmonis]CAF2993696.1 unnamed protein product [Lepeophtheirus salmonis]
MGEISSDHMKNILQEVKKYLQECIQIFSYEPTCLQEGKLAAIARLDLITVFQNEIYIYINHNIILLILKLRKASPQMECSFHPCVWQIPLVSTIKKEILLRD